MLEHLHLQPAQTCVLMRSHQRLWITPNGEACVSGLMQQGHGVFHAVMLPCRNVYRHHWHCFPFVQFCNVQQTHGSASDPSVLAWRGLALQFGWYGQVSRLTLAETL